MKKNDIFGPYRVKTNILTNSSGVAETFHKFYEISEWSSENLRSMASYPGPADGEIVWCFQNEDDAVLFALKWS